MEDFTNPLILVDLKYLSSLTKAAESALARVLSYRGECTFVIGLSFRPLSVTTFSAATRNETAKKRYQRVQCHTGFIFKMAILLRSKVMA